jgi:hypothetical protein
MESSLVSTSLYKYFPSIQQYRLHNKKERLGKLFESYMRPAETSDQSEQEQELLQAWGSKLPALNDISPDNAALQRDFFADVLIFYLFYDIVNDKGKYPDNVPRVDLPQQLVNRAIKYAQLIFKNEQPLVEVQVPVKIFGDLHGQFSDLLEIF